MNSKGIKVDESGDGLLLYFLYMYLCFEGYLRQGMALEGLNRFNQALKSYHEGLLKGPTDKILQVIF